MKYFILSISIAVIIALLSSCGESGPSERELELEAKLDSLESVHKKSQESISEYVAAINEIQSGLNKIKQQEKILVNRASSGNELQESDVEAINNDIDAIYELMVENRKKLDNLRGRLNRSGAEVSEFKISVENLTAQLNEKDREIKELQAIIQQKDLDLKKLSERLNEMSVNLEKLEEESTHKSELIEEKEDLLNTAYYIVDTRSNLRDKEIITREGGFIGIGGVQTVRKRSSEFTKIDIRELQLIDLKDASKVTFLTDHPESSYTKQTNESGEYTQLVIEDAEEFWSVSKYLVLMIR